MAALTAMKSMRQRLAGRQGGLTYEVEVVAQHAAELQLRPGTRALFLLKRRHRLCVTEAAEVDGSGVVEWNTRCTQTATLFKEGHSGAWRPKEFVFKVQVVTDGQPPGHEAAPRTVAKASLDLSQFCQAEPLGPKQLVLPLRPAGVLFVSIRTQWLQHFDRDADTLTDISYLSLAPSAVTSVAGAAGLAGDAEQDLSGFDGAAAAAAAAGAVSGASSGGMGLPGGQEGSGGGGSIRAVYPPAAPTVPQQQQQQGGATPLHKRRPSVAGVLRLPKRGNSLKEQLAPGQQQQKDGPGAVQQGVGFQFAQAAATSGGGLRRPPGASQLLLPDSQQQAGEAPTPTLMLRGGQRATQAQGLQPAAQAAAQQQGQQGPQQSAAVGLPQECWSPIDLQEAVKQIYDSEEEPTPRASVLGTVRRMFGRARNATPPPPPGTTARQLHASFGTPAPSPPRVTPDAGEVATIDREGSLSALRKRCKRLLLERDEARAEGYAEAALAVEQGVEIDKLRRAKDMLLQRLQATEAQLLATYRDEASTDLIQALAAARVEAAQREFQAMELQGQLRRRDAAIDRLRAQLTRMEAKYCAALNSLSPGAKASGPPSPWAASAAGSAAHPPPRSPPADSAASHHHRGAHSGATAAAASGAASVATTGWQGLDVCSSEGNGSPAAAKARLPGRELRSPIAAA